MMNRKRIGILIAGLFLTAGVGVWLWQFVPPGPLAVRAFVPHAAAKRNTSPRVPDNLAPRDTADFSKGSQRNRLPHDPLQHSPIQHSPLQNNALQNEHEVRLDDMPSEGAESLSWAAVDHNALEDFVLEDSEGLGEFEPAFDTLVVCPEAWQEALTPWLEYRTAQGRTIGLADNPRTAQQLKDLLVKLYPRGLRYVLLVGDVPSRINLQGIGVPTQRVDSVVSKRFGGPARVASDHWFADMTGDHAPDLAIGRWSVRNPEQLTVMVEKTLRFETDLDPEFAKRRIEFVAGVGGFGAVEDNVIESTATRLLAELIPGQYTVGMTHASWRSVYCPGPQQYQQKIFDSLSCGALFWVYMGHGSWNSLDSAVFPDCVIPTITTENVDRLSGSTSPIALLLACSTGQFDRSADCLAESLNRSPHGPVAVVAGTGVTAPYGLANFGLELLSLHRDGGSADLGTWFQQAKRSMVLNTMQQREVRQAGGNEGETIVNSAELVQASAIDDLLPDSAVASTMNMADYRMLLRQIAVLFSPTSDMLDQEILEHVDMMTLFGDPLLRLPQYSPIELIATKDESGAGIFGRLPRELANDLSVEVEVVYPLGKIGFRPLARRKYISSPEFQQQLEQEYQQANDRVIHREMVAVEHGQFYLPLASIGVLPNRIWVRATAQDGSSKALGFSEIHLPALGPELVSVQMNDDQDEAKQAKTITVDLFDGKSLHGWKSTNFGGEGEVFVEYKN